MCVYEKDNPQYFDEAIQSILNQTVKPNEVVLVIDGPIPEVIENVVRKYETYDGFKVVRLEKNMGHGRARQISLEHCTYDLVALMDADDLSLQTRFEKQIGYFEQNPEISIVGGNIEEFIDNIDNVVGIRAVPANDLEIKSYMKKRCPFNQVTVMFKKKDVFLAGGYIDWPNEEDYFLWIRMAQHGLFFKNISEILVKVRVGEEMYARRGGWDYFCSEAKLQNYMRRHHIIGIKDYVINIGLRFIIQVILPNRLRGFIFKKFSRVASEPNREAL